MVQIVLQPAFGALVVELSSTRNKEQQVVPEDNTISSDLQSKWAEGNLMKQNVGNKTVYGK